MSSNLSVANISRLTRGLTLDQNKGLEARREAFAMDRLQEVDEFIQVAVSGSAAGIVSWQRVSVSLDAELYDANAQQMRFSDLTEPSVSFGFRLTSIADNDEGHLGVCIDANVESFKERSGSVINGIVLVVGAHLPGYTGAGIEFSGLLNVKVSGWGTLESSDGASPDLDQG